MLTILNDNNLHNELFCYSCYPRRSYSVSAMLKRDFQQPYVLYHFLFWLLFRQLRCPRVMEPLQL